MRVVLMCISLLSALAAQAAAPLEFSDSAEEQRFKNLISEIRCLVCQNQSLIDSDAELAKDLRSETYKLFKAGHSDAEIVQFLVDRYGDFVLYRPPLKPSTYLLWFGPFGLFLLVAFLISRAIKRQQSRTTQLSETERARAQALLQSDEASR